VLCLFPCPLLGFVTQNLGGYKNCYFKITVAYGRCYGMFIFVSVLMGLVLLVFFSHWLGG
jgi:hypothetical protein